MIINKEIYKLENIKNVKIVEANFYNFFSRFFNAEKKMKLIIDNKIVLKDFESKINNIFYEIDKIIKFQEYRTTQVNISSCNMTSYKKSKVPMIEIK